MGTCDLHHSEELKEQFEASGDTHIFDHIIEPEFKSKISDIDRQIKRARLRVEEEKGEEINPDTNPEVLKLQADIEKNTQEAEAAGEEGDIDKAQQLMAKVEELGKQKADTVARLLQTRNELTQRTGMDVNKKLRVCDVCGCFLSILDSDKRLADHFMGKQHLGYQIMRDYLEEIEKYKVANPDRAYGGSRDDRGGRIGRGDSRDRDRDRDRRDGRDSRDRDRYRRRDSRDRDRSSRYRDDSRDRDRGYRREERDWDRGDRYRRRSRSADRYRPRDRERRRSRS
jgi:hypothetical protein